LRLSTTYFSGPVSNPLLFIVIGGIFNSYAAIFGFEKIKRYSCFSVPLLTLFCLWILFELFSNNLGEMRLDYVKTGGLNYWQGVDLVIGGYIAGALAASDFTRYTLNNRSNWMGVLPGTFIMSFFLGLIGMFCTAATGEWNPVKEIQSFGLGVPALVFIFIANGTTNFNLLYSSGLAVTNIFPKISRWKNTLVSGIAGTALAVMGIEQHLQDILSFLALLFSPVLGVLLMDFFINNRLSGQETPAKSPQKLNIPGFIAILTGIVVARGLPKYWGTSVTGLLSSSLCYLLLKAALDKKLKMQ